MSIFFSVSKLRENIRQPRPRGVLSSERGDKFSGGLSRELGRIFVERSECNEPIRTQTWAKRGKH